MNTRYNHDNENVGDASSRVLRDTCFVTERKLGTKQSCKRDPTWRRRLAFSSLDYFHTKPSPKPSTKAAPKLWLAFRNMSSFGDI